MFSDDDLLPISALQHLVFCERQWGLIHLEQVWSENFLTAKGRELHERTHEAAAESRGDVRTARGLKVHSLRLGLSGQTDVVEFHRVAPSAGLSAAADGPDSLELPGVSGRWRAVVVEYKRGKPKVDRCDEVQLCAQALCLEEMWQVRLAAGAIFYGRPRRRLPVAFDAVLRDQTEAAARRLHELTARGETPPPRLGKHCKSCSLVGLCLPKPVGQGRSAARYVAACIEAALAGSDERAGERDES